MPTVHQQEVTIQYVNLVKPGKKFGSIKTSEGQIFACPPDLLNQFSVGEVCKIDYGTWDSGGFHIVKKVQAVAAPPLKQNIRPSVAPREGRQIFVAAILKEFISKGDVPLDPDAIAGAIGICCEGYDRSKLSGAQAQTRDDLEDSVPY